MSNDMTTPLRNDAAGSEEKGSEARGKYEVSPFRWAVLAGFSLVAHNNGMAFISLSSISGKAQTFYGVTSSDINLVVILFYALYVPFMPVGTWLVNSKDGVRRCVLVAALLLAVGTVVRVLGMNPNKESFYIMVLGSAICAINAPFVMTCFTLVPNNWFPVEERSLATSIGVLANQVGMITGYLIPPLIVTEEEQGSRLKQQILLDHIVLAGICVGTLIYCYFFFFSKPRVPAGPAAKREEMSMREATRLCFSNPQFWVWGGAFAIAAPIYWDMGTLLYQTMSPSDYSDTQIQIPGVLLQAIAIPAMIGVGAYLDRTKKYALTGIMSLVWASLSMAAFTYVLTLKDTTRNLILITVCACSAGFAFSTMQPALLDIVAERTFPVPQGYTCAMLYFGTMVMGAVYIAIGDYMTVEGFNIFLTLLTTAMLALTVAGRAAFPYDEAAYRSLKVLEPAEEEKVETADGGDGTLTA